MPPRRALKMLILLKKKVMMAARRFPISSVTLLLIPTFPHAIQGRAANISDQAGAIEMLEESRDHASLPRIENILLDGGYTGQPFADKIREILNCSLRL
jgi:hypothetical protein